MAVHIRLDDDVANMVAKVAKRNSRSAAKEVNHVLREHYTVKLMTLVGLSPDEWHKQTYTTNLDPRPRLLANDKLALAGHNPAWKESPLEVSFGAVGKKSYRKMAAFAKETTKRYNGK